MSFVLNLTDITRFKEKFEEGSPDECWEWKGMKNAQGYGRFWLNGNSNVRAHRISWIIFNGSLNDELEVCHKCDNPSCVNPGHLFIGTHSQNIQDCWDKGRHSFNGVNTMNSLPKPEGFAVGENNGRAVLTEDAVRMIRQLFDEGYKAVELSKVFGVCSNMIRYIVKRRYWGHVL